MESNPNPTQPNPSPGSLNGPGIGGAKMTKSENFILSHLMASGSIQIYSQESINAANRILRRFPQSVSIRKSTGTAMVLQINRPTSGTTFQQFES